MHAVGVVIFALWALFWLGWLAASFGNKPGRSGLTRSMLALWARVNIGRNWGRRSW